MAEYIWFLGISILGAGIVIAMAINNLSDAIRKAVGQQSTSSRNGDFAIWNAIHGRADDMKRLSLANEAVATALDRLREQLPKATPR